MFYYFLENVSEFFPSQFSISKLIFSKFKSPEKIKTNNILFFFWTYFKLLLLSSCDLVYEKKFVKLYNIVEQLDTVWNFWKFPHKNI